MPNSFFKIKEIAIIQIIIAITFFNIYLSIANIRLAPISEPQIVRRKKKASTLYWVALISFLKPTAPLMLKKINANIFVATAFFEIIPNEISTGTVINDVPPTDTLKILTIKERTQAIKILIKLILVFGLFS